MKSARIPVLVCLLAVAFVVPIHNAFAAPVCQQFEVGSEKWQKCVEREARGGGGKNGNGGNNQDSGTDDTTNDNGTNDTNKDLEGVVCTEFQVGSPKWEDCIKGAATGGGLMPWIVVVPLGVMVLGMIFMFSRQAMRARNFESFSSAQIGSTAGTWLIFVALIELAIGVGSAIADSRAAGSGGGYGIAAMVLLGVGVVMLIAGIVVTIKSRKKRHVEQTGVPGEARVMRLSQTGTYINENPVFMFELQVNAPGVPQFQATQSFTVPMYLVQRIGPGAVLPVKVDPSDTSEIVVDWGKMSLQPWTDPAAPATVGQGPSSWPGTPQS